MADEDDPNAGMVSFSGVDECGCPPELRAKNLHMSRCEKLREPVLERELSEAIADSQQKMRFLTEAQRERDRWQGVAATLRAEVKHLQSIINQTPSIWATQQIEQLRAEVARLRSEAETAFQLGWFWAHSEYPEEGWCGPFASRAEAAANAQGAGCDLEEISFREIGDVAQRLSLAESMRERAAQLVEQDEWLYAAIPGVGYAMKMVAAAIRSLPLEPEEPSDAEA